MRGIERKIPESIRNSTGIEVIEEKTDKIIFYVNGWNFRLRIQILMAFPPLLQTATNLDIRSPSCPVNWMGGSGHPPRQRIATADNVAMGGLPARLQGPSPCFSRSTPPCFFSNGSKSPLVSLDSPMHPGFSCYPLIGPLPAGNRLHQAGAPVQVDGMNMVIIY